jgi:phage gp46-like protein
MINITNNTQYNGEPAIINGDVVKNGGDYKRVTALNNKILILVGTDSGYWGNLIEPVNSQIKGGLELLKGRAITSNFLKEHTQKVESLLSPMITSKQAKSVKAESFNRFADRVDWTALIVLKDGQKYYFESSTGEGKFIN